MNRRQGIVLWLLPVAKTGQTVEPWTVAAAGIDVGVVVLQLKARGVMNVGLAPGKEFSFKSNGGHHRTFNLENESCEHDGLCNEARSDKNKMQDGNTYPR